ncbi:hypothetical protein [Niabella ginsengisoli]|uniref:ACT domain-containing protein n=1 Tax=Niabella ginsengisoli TaxID=522298 RepID=A0ABS9SEF9_9BACT|nr:hypothetical protein [Niabella ginsengisoli]MCH5596746.1 hypothetical protein [Niabella ginsengisoli]
MKILLEIPDDKAPALMAVLSDISYVKTSVLPKKKTVYLLSIYDKPETQNLSAKQINDLLQLLS